MSLRTKRIYDPPAAGDGHRLLVMRFWPRGVRKERVDAWDRGLAPSRELLTDLRSEAIDWVTYTRRFHWEMAHRDDAVAAFASLAQRAETETVTLLCWCHDETRCHRTLLKALIEDAASVGAHGVGVRVGSGARRGARLP